MREGKKNKRRELKPRHHAVKTHGGLTGVKAVAWSYGDPKSRQVYVELRTESDFLLGMVSFRVPR